MGDTPQIPDNAPFFEERPRTEYGNFCLHQSYTVVSGKRLIRCNHCQASLDAFDVVERWARGASVRDTYERQLKELRAKLEKLHAEEKRVKARVRNASRKDSDAAVKAALDREREERGRCVANLYAARAEIERCLRRLGHDESAPTAGEGGGA